MGKPFEQELISLPSSVEWAFAQQIDPALREMILNLADYPLLVVGSGGSLSGAHFLSRVHELMTGQMAKPTTPLDFHFSSISPSESAVLFLTASGNNKDIFNAFETAVSREFAAIGVVCAKLNSKILQKARIFPHVRTFEYPNPTGKDGFLALGSLLSTCILVSRAYGALDVSPNSVRHLAQFVPDFANSEWVNVLSRNTILGLASEWAWPALVDLESKFSEAGLGNVLLTEFRNFAHGRHHWLVRKGAESGLLILETPPVLNLARKTADLLPSKYPIASLRTFLDGPLGGIDLLKQVFWLVNEAGKRAKIDPGRPHVPEFGRKIYRLGLSSVGARSSRRFNNRSVWLTRKANATSLVASSLIKFLDSFLEAMNACEFSGIVFDYDGTLCDPTDRFKQPKPDVALSLDNLLSHGIPMGIATGRGRSVQKALREVVKKKYWERVLVGNYNCSVTAPLTKEPPPQENNPNGLIQVASNLLHRDFGAINKCQVEVRARQISLIMTEPTWKRAIFQGLLETLANLSGLKIVQSGHSIDILHPDVSKTRIVDELKATMLAGERNILVIGDQGQYGGNDFELLSLPHSLSVNKVSASLTSCWNLSPVGSRGAEAVVSMMRAMRAAKGFFKVNVEELERETCK